MPTVETRSRGTIGAMQLAVEHLKKLGPGVRSVGVERGFLPADAESALREALPDVKIVDAWSPLDRLRAIKTPDELAKLKRASDLVVGAMLAVMGGHGPGVTTRQLVEALRTEETKRGLTFEYCLVTAGRSFNRAPSEQTWEAGEIMSLDSGGNLGGYIGDLCRMAIHGEPDGELVDLLGEIDTIQMAARKPLRRGATGNDLYRHAMDALNASPSAAHLKFEAHGMGLVPHEAPRLTYTREDLDKPLEPGMVLSIETTMHHPKRGFIKLEDTVAVTENGWEGFGDAGRGWNRGGA
jgi:Xaa-Pro aminopeptidase